MSHLALLALVDVPGVTDLVAFDRIQPQFLPQGADRPAVTFNLVSQTRDSADNTDIGIVRSRWQANVWSSSYQEAHTIREALRVATQRKKGTFGGVVVDDVFIGMAQDFYDADEEHASGGQGEHQLTLDLELIHRET